MQASGSSFCAEGLAKWHEETIGAMEQTHFFPLFLKYHPRLIAAGYLHWVKKAAQEKEEPLKVPEEVGQHAWFLYVDPSIQAEDLEEVQSVISKELEYFSGASSEPQQAQ